MFERYTERARRVIFFASYAAEEAERMLHNYIGTEHVLLGLMREEKSVAASILSEKGMRLSAVREEIVQLLNEKANVGKAKETPLLSEFSRDLTEAAARGALDPLVGREEELARIIQVLCRRTRNNPVLIGEPGVGKTALVEGLANKIVQGDVPVYLADKRILALDISLIVAGTKYRGQFEERLKTIMRELTESHNIVIFIDELHTLVGAGSAEGSLDAANILKPALSRGEIQCIGATTPAEYRKYIEKDRSLERRFQAVKVASPTEEETIQILRGIKDRYEKFHHVAYRDEALEAAVYQSSRYITDRFLPDKAIDLLDEAGSRVKLRDAAALEDAPEFSRKIRVVVDRGDAPSSAFFRDEEVAQRENLQIVREHWDMSGSGGHQVTKGDIDDVVSKWTGIPISALKEEESAKLLRMEDELHKRIVSQDNAISAVARAIRRTRAGLKSPARPVGSFLFLGPTGVGKTEVARSLAGFLFGSERALVRFDMSEYMEKHAVSKLIGSPPGYVGHEEGGQLTERVKRNPYSMILFDEIEKAHPDVANLLLQILEDGQLTDAYGNQVDFKNTLILMTSNIGSKLVLRGGRMGFGEGSEQASFQRIEEEILAELRRSFSPEFINRIDEVIVFNPLGEAELRRIVDILIEDVNETLAERGLRLEVSPEAREWLLHKADIEPSTGARPLRRTIQRHIQDAVSEILINQHGGDPIDRIYVDL